MFEQKLLFRVDFLSVTLDHRVQCHGGFKIKDILDFFLLLLFFLYGIIQFEQHVPFRVFLSVTYDIRFSAPEWG